MTAEHVDILRVSGKALTVQRLVVELPTVNEDHGRFELVINGSPFDLSLPDAQTLGQRIFRMARDT